MWDEEQQAELVQRYTVQKMSIEAIADAMHRTPVAIELRLRLSGEIDIPFTTARSIPHPDRDFDGLLPWPEEHVKLLLQCFAGGKMTLFQIAYAVGHDAYAVHHKAMSLKLLSPFAEFGLLPDPCSAAQLHEAFFGEKCK